MTSANTIAENKLNDQLSGKKQVWLFGYGSLIFKADFDFVDRKPATIYGWQRRFWQGSHDHRGTPEAPGRVVTLVEKERAPCRGMGYLINIDVFDHLDFREKNGYLRFVTKMVFDDDTEADSLVYIATSDNEAYLGYADEKAIAHHIHHSAGPSGPNSEYLFRLAESLRELNTDDPHVFSIEQHLAQLALSPEKQ